MPCTATVATRPRARHAAVIPPARSICDNNKSPKISPLGLVSAGMANVRIAGLPLGSGSPGAVMIESGPGWSTDAVMNLSLDIHNPTITKNVRNPFLSHLFRWRLSLHQKRQICSGSCMQNTWSLI